MESTEDNKTFQTQIFQIEKLTRWWYFSTAKEGCTLRVLTTIGSYFKTFQMAEAPFLASVEATLGERYTPQMDTIYHVIAGSTKEQKYFQIIFWYLQIFAIFSNVAICRNIWEETEEKYLLARWIRFYCKERLKNGLSFHSLKQTNLIWQNVKLKINLAKCQTHN